MSHIVRAVPEPQRPSPVHLRPAAELAPRVLLPGDPGRALAVAQALLDRPRMFNHHRGLWGYTGTGPDGQPVSIQSTGMGGPSAAIVAHELIALGARVLVRIGTCGALVSRLRLGDLLTATDVIAADGTSRALGAAERLRPEPELRDALLAAGGGSGETVVSTDLFYDEPPERVAAWVAAGACAAEMEAAALLQVAGRAGVSAACLLTVSDEPAGGGRRLDHERLQAAGVRMAEVALAALSPMIGSSSVPSRRTSA